MIRSTLSSFLATMGGNMYILKRSNLGGFHKAFGRVIRNSQDLQDAIREHNDRTGESIVECGDADIKSMAKKNYDKRFSWDDVRKKAAEEISQTVEGD